MIIKNLTKNFYINLFIIFSIFIIDRITKIYVIGVNGKNSYEDLYSSKFLNINLIWNEGIAFGLFSFSQNNLYNLLTLIISIIIIVILKMIINSYGIKKYGLMMIFGGALGNLFDRIFYKAVPDFIDFHIGEFHWFVFNVADIFITIGVIIMILYELILNNQKNEHI
ncbi:signal peptidase II [Candidatus Woesearchaeota archaeon]|jgi:signal peptidase II|nr:signal peptidase II [Candidatus Woesearchaeota archaeon]